MQNNEIKANETLTQVSTHDNSSEIIDEKPKTTEDGNVATHSLNRDVITSKTEQYLSDWVKSGGDDI